MTVNNLNLKLSNLPTIQNARLPQTYQAAKVAIKECTRIDECQDWADKSEALASYARQAKDDQLRKMVDRIQARAIRRCGELLKEFNAQGRRSELSNGTDGKSQGEAARDAGLSERQELTAVRVANVPESEFENAVESDDPPTVTQLAERGKKTSSTLIIDIGDRDPEEFSLSTQAQGQLRRFAEFCEQTDPETIARGSFPREVSIMKEQIAAIDGWLRKLSNSLEAQLCTATQNFLRKCKAL